RLCCALAAGASVVDRDRLRDGPLLESIPGVQWREGCGDYGRRLAVSRTENHDCLPAAVSALALFRPEDGLETGRRDLIFNDDVRYLGPGAHPARSGIRNLCLHHVRDRADPARAEYSRDHGISTRIA